MLSLTFITFIVSEKNRNIQVLARNRHSASQPNADHYTDSHFSCESIKPLPRHLLKKMLLPDEVSELVSWYFEPSQPQRINSRLKTMFNLSSIYSERKSSNHKLFKNYKISPDTNLQKTYTNIKNNIFEELVPSVSPQLKKKKAH